MNPISRIESRRTEHLTNLEKNLTDYKALSAFQRKGPLKKSIRANALKLRTSLYNKTTLTKEQILQFQSIAEKYNSIFSPQKGKTKASLLEIFESNAIKDHPEVVVAIDRDHKISISEGLGPQTVSRVQSVANTVLGATFNADDLNSKINNLKLKIDSFTNPEDLSGLILQAKKLANTSIQLIRTGSREDAISTQKAIAELMNSCFKASLEFSDSRAYKIKHVDWFDKWLFNSRLRSLVELSEASITREGEAPIKLAPIETSTLDVLENKSSELYQDFIENIKGIIEKKKFSEDFANKAIDLYRNTIRPFENHATFNLDSKHSRENLKLLVAHAKEMSELKTQIESPGPGNIQAQVNRLSNTIPQKIKALKKKIESWGPSTSQVPNTLTSENDPYKLRFLVSTCNDMLDRAADRATSLSNPDLTTTNINTAINDEILRRRNLLITESAQLVVQRKQDELLNQPMRLLDAEYPNRSEEELSTFLSTPLNKSRESDLRSAWDRWFDSDKVGATERLDIENKTPNQIFELMHRSNQALPTDTIKADFVSRFKPSEYIKLALDTNPDATASMLAEQIIIVFPSLETIKGDLLECLEEQKAIRNGIHEAITTVQENAMHQLTRALPMEIQEDGTYPPVEDGTVSSLLEELSLTVANIKDLLQHNISKEELSHAIKWDGRSVAPVTANYQAALENAQRKSDVSEILEATRLRETYTSIFPVLTEEIPVQTTLKKVNSLMAKTIQLQKKHERDNKTEATSLLNSLIIDLFLQKRRLETLNGTESEVASLKKNLSEIETIISTTSLSPSDSNKLIKSIEQRVQALQENISIEDDVTEDFISNTISDYVKIYEIIKKQTSLLAAIPSPSGEVQSFLSQRENSPYLTEVGLRKKINVAKARNLITQLTNLHNKVMSTGYNNLTITKKDELLSKYITLHGNLVQTFSAIGDFDNIRYERKQLATNPQNAQGLIEIPADSEDGNPPPPFSTSPVLTSYLEAVKLKQEALNREKATAIKEIVERSTRTTIDAIAKKTTDKVLQETQDSLSPELTQDERKIINSNVTKAKATSDEKTLRLIQGSFGFNINQEINTLISDLNTPGTASNPATIQKRLSNCIQTLDSHLTDPNARKNCPEYCTWTESIINDLNNLKQKFPEIDETELRRLREDERRLSVACRNIEKTTVATDLPFKIEKIESSFGTTILTIRHPDFVELKTYNTYLYNGNLRVKVDNSTYESIGFGQWGKVVPAPTQQEVAQLTEQYNKAKHDLDQENRRILELKNTRQHKINLIEAAVRDLQQNPSISDALQKLNQAILPLMTPQEADVLINDYKISMLKNMKPHIINTILNPRLEKQCTLISETKALFSENEWSNFVETMCRSNRFNQYGGSRRVHRPTRSQINEWKRTPSLDSLAAIAQARGQTPENMLKEKLCKNRPNQDLTDAHAKKLLEIAYKMQNDPEIQISTLLVNSLKEIVQSYLDQEGDAEPSQELIQELTLYLQTLNVPQSIIKTETLLTNMKLQQKNASDAQRQCTFELLEEKIARFVTGERFDLDAAEASGFSRNEMLSFQNRHFTKEKALVSLEAAEPNCPSYTEAINPILSQP